MTDKYVMLTARAQDMYQHRYDEFLQLDTPYRVYEELGDGCVIYVDSDIQKRVDGCRKDGKWALDPPEFTFIEPTEAGDLGRNYIVWSPASELPPSKRMTEKQARKVARNMAESHEAEFYVAKLTTKYNVVHEVTKELV